MRLRPWILCAVVVTGCGGPDLPPPEPLAENVVLTLTMDALEYAVGAKARVTLTNGSDGRIEYNHWCTTRLERHVDGAWQHAWSPRGCPLPLEMLNSGQSATWEFGMATYGPGVFRVAFDYNSELTTYSPGFTVY